MFKRIAVPLDGSLLAEQALPEAVKLARCLDASIVLLHGVELPSYAVRATAHNLPLIEAAEVYLQGVCNNILTSKLSPPFEEERLDYRVIYDTKPARLAEIASTEKADLMVMTTHGRTGFSRLVMGSIATGLVRQSSLPVVLIHPRPLSPHRALSGLIEEACAPENSAPARIVVPLDSLSGSEKALVPAADLARQLKATIYLLNVVPVTEPALVSDTSARQSDAGSEDRALIQQWKDEGFQYLEDIQTGLEAQGINVVKVVRAGNPAEQIAEYINLAQPALLVMATHARDRLGRALFGNLTEEVMHLSSQPVVMVHT